ncbi:Pentatricopeptide repeat-containing protein [Smittium culicis]|uniref:Pentatricopeptide repeat-containing protein n=1 Tax=Smittium culicis TaxID=133412 RepID=A0A1R1YLF4_9FUNG|nr:Pentatricopeptide repeat-containing protein [Smittium culicis]
MKSAYLTLEQLCKTSLFKYGYPVSNATKYITDVDDVFFNLPFLGIDPLTYINQTPNLYSYTALLQHASELKAISNLEYIWTCMLDSGIKPDSIAYLKRIKAHCLAGNYENTSKIYWEMVDSNLVPKPHSVDFVFKSLFCNFDFSGLISIAYNSIVELNTNLNTLAFNYLIMAIFRNSPTNHSMSLITQIFALMIQRLPNRDYKKFEDSIFLTEISKKYNKISKYELPNPRSSLGMKTLDNVEPILDWLSSNSQNNLHNPNTSGHLEDSNNFQDSSVMYNQLPYSVNKNFTRMNDLHNKSDTKNTYSKILSIIERLNIGADKLGSPDKNSQSNIIHSKPLKSKISLAPPPNLQTFTLLSRYALKVEDYELAIGVYEEFENYSPFHKWDRPHNPRFYGFVFASYLAIGDTNGAKYIWSKMCDNGYILDDHKNNFEEHSPYYYNKSIRCL